MNNPSMLNLRFKILVIISMILFASCSSESKSKVVKKIVPYDSNFVRKIPLITINDNYLLKQLYIITETEKRKSGYTENIACFLINTRYFLGDSIIVFASRSYFDIDLSIISEVSNFDYIKGMFKYNDVVFFCRSNVFENTNLFELTSDSLRVFNLSLIRYNLPFPIIDDSGSTIVYKIKNKKLNETGVDSLMSFFGW